MTTKGTERPERSGRPAKAAAPKASGPDLKALGQRIRATREASGIGLRELARRIECSPGLVSQVENGLVAPSVGTLYAITTELGVPVDELFHGAPVPVLDSTPAAPPEAPNGHEPPAPAGRKPPSSGAGTYDLVRSSSGRRVQLPHEVKWRMLAGGSTDLIEFLEITYPPGAMSCALGEMLSHEGEEHGFVVEGRFDLQIGDESIVLYSGDSIAYDAQVPHRLSNPTDQTSRGVWIVDARHGSHAGHH